MEERLQTDDTVKMIYSGATLGKPDVQELGRRNGKGNGENRVLEEGPSSGTLLEQKQKDAKGGAGQVELGIITRDTPVKNYEYSIPIKMNNKNEFIIEYFLIFLK